MIQINPTDVINKVASYPLTFTGGTGATAELSDTMHIQHVGTWKASNASQVNAARGMASTKQIFTLGAVAVNALNTLNSPSVDEYVNISLSIQTTNHESMYARFTLVAGDVKTYQVKAKAALSGAALAGDMLVQWQAAFTAEQSRFGSEASPFTLAIAGAAGNEVITFTAQDEHIYVTNIEVTDEQGDLSDIVKFVPVVTVEQFEGAGTGLYIQENVRLLTYASTMPYNTQQDQLVMDTDDLYTGIAWNQTTSRDNLSVMGVNGGKAESVINHVLYIREDAVGALGASGYIEDILIFLSRGDVNASFLDNTGAVQDDIMGELPGQTGYDAAEAAARVVL